MQQNNMQRRFLGVWIPKEIWLMKNLSITAKAVWAEIRSLEDEEKGGCFASNEYLAEFTGLKIRALQDILSQLRAKGLIKTVSFNGRQRIIQTVDPKNTAYQTCRKLHGSNAENCTHIIKNINKENISKDISKKDASASSSSLPSKNKLIEREPNVHTTQKEHEKLETEYGKEIRDKCYKILSEWKEDTPKYKWKKNDYRSILRWVVNAYKEKLLRKTKLDKADHVKKNKETAKKVIKNFYKKAKEKGITISMNQDYIIFAFTVGNVNPTSIRFNEFGFDDQLKNIMKKRNLL